MQWHVAQEELSMYECTQEMHAQEVHSIHICWEIYTCKHARSYMSMRAEYAELQSLTWQWLDQCTKMYLAWCCSSWSQALDADHYEMMILNLCDAFHKNEISFHSNAILWKCNLMKLTHVYDLEFISRSCQPLLFREHLTKALDRLWGRSFSTFPDLLTSLSMIYILKKCCMTAHAACWMQSLDCIARIQTYTTIYANSCLNSRVNPTQLRIAVLNDNLMWDRWQLWEQSRNLVEENVVWVLISENWAGSSVSQLISLISWSVCSYVSMLVDKSLYR